MRPSLGWEDAGLSFPSLCFCLTRAQVPAEHVPGDALSAQGSSQLLCLLAHSTVKHFLPNWGFQLCSSNEEGSDPVALSAGLQGAQPSTSPLSRSPCPAQPLGAAPARTSAFRAVSAGRAELAARPDELLAAVADPRAADFVIAGPAVVAGRLQPSKAHCKWGTSVRLW